MRGVAGDRAADLAGRTRPIFDLHAPAPADTRDATPDVTGAVRPGDVRPAGMPGEPAAPGRRRLRTGLSWAVTGLALLLVLGALVAPDRLGEATPAALLRIPVEALAAVVLVLVLPPRVRRPAAGVAGALLGLLLIVKCLDVGFSATLARPFHVMFDWVLLRPGFEFLVAAVGTPGAVLAAVGIGLLLVAVPVLTTLSALRLTRVAVRHRRPALGATGVLAAAWVVCAVLGIQLVAGVPVADRSSAGLAWERGGEAWTDVRDQYVFTQEAAVDAYRDVPGDRLLTGLQGKDVVLAFVESYGRSAVEDPELAPRVNAVLDAGTARLTTAGFGTRSAFLTSSTAGGASWLAHGTLLSGLRIDTSNRYRSLVKSDRLTLNNAFRRAGWRSVAVVPGVTRDWPEASFFGYDRIYPAKDLGYRGPAFGWATTPDQFTLEAFQKLERARAHEPVMAEIPLVSSHAPWAKVPRLVDWSALGDGSVFGTPAGQLPPEPLRRGTAKVRADYRTSIEYSLSSLISYVERYGDDDLVVVFLGDHQPAPIVTGEGASHDVPVTIVAKDPKVLAAIDGWGWVDGLRPGPGAPVWPMEAFRDRFLTAYGPR
jgi:hypothetical protein